MLDGTNASATQRSRPALETATAATPGTPLKGASAAEPEAMDATGSASATADPEPLAITAHTATGAMRTTYATVHAMLCAARVSVGSSRTGYASSAAMLPRLLAA